VTVRTERMSWTPEGGSRYSIESVEFAAQ
jgi:hypothetical protein